MNNSNNPYNTDENDLDPNFITGDSGDPFPGFHNNFIFSPWSFPINKANSAAPTSYPIQNVGFEIIEIGNDYIVADLYVNYPENASPQYPWFFNGFYQNEKITLNWDPNSEPDFNRYEIYRSYVSNSGFSRIETIYNVSTTSYNDNNFQLPVSSFVYYKMRSVDVDNKDSVFTKILNINVPPTAPQNFTYSGYDANRHPVFTWNTNPEEDIAGYNLYKEKPVGSGTIIKVNSLLISTNQYTDINETVCMDGFIADY